jgi:hypothetical protein
MHDYTRRIITALGDPRRLNFTDFIDESNSNRAVHHGWRLIADRLPDCSFWQRRSEKPVGDSFKLVFISQLF